MGLFDFFKSNKSSSNNSKSEKIKQTRTKEGTKAILSKLGINPYYYNHEEMEPSEISLNEELAGAIKVSDITFELGDKEFDYISLTDNKDGTKSLYLAQNHPEERSIKVLVDKFYVELGEAKYLGQEFTKYDLMTMNEQSHFELREWQLPGFKIVIGYNKNPKMDSNYVLVEEN
ncbi:hypothetical protein LB467_01410 [Salegentibacter sp. JZCK2]|uniref:hypothetical protein n=1 Tax=Salegentibacter tibetensis TaxID=2873600 RepID=UPI001CCFEE71|nr:hypothetical protein [Salegentibacter tibetensis]MBZ9728333.1 hypothetical protein [Salegentibacter tibetensis]